MALKPTYATFLGNFHTGLLHGLGITEFCNGDTYAGEIEYGLWHGKGLLKLADGSHYAGCFCKVGSRHPSDHLSMRSTILFPRLAVICRCASFDFVSSQEQMHHVRHDERSNHARVFVLDGFACGRAICTSAGMFMLPCMGHEAESIRAQIVKRSTAFMTAFQPADMLHCR